jgi:hypothetical protein
LETSCLEKKDLALDMNQRQGKVLFGSEFQTRVILRNIGSKVERLRKDVKIFRKQTPLKNVVVLRKNSTPAPDRITFQAEPINFVKSKVLAGFLRLCGEF